MLTGCVDQSAPAASASERASPSSKASSAAPAKPTFRPTGTAADNLAYFNFVNTAFLAPDPTPGGRRIIDNLVAAGFDKKAMQVTSDTTTLGRDVDSTQFSVRFGSSCLVGSASASGYVGVVGPAVSGVLCLLGTTRAIDW